MPEATSTTALAAHSTLELEVIQACARTEWAGDFEQRIRQLLQPGIDWPHLVRLAIDHQVLPLVYQSFKRWPQGSIPPEVAAECQQHTGAVLRNNLRLPRSLDPLYSLVRPLRVASDLLHAVRANARKR